MVFTFAVLLADGFVLLAGLLYLFVWVGGPGAGVIGDIVYFIVDTLRYIAYIIPCSYIMLRYIHTLVASFDIYLDTLPHVYPSL